MWRQGAVRLVERVECPLEADRLVLDHLVRLGCDPAQPRECRHYVYVPAEPFALALTQALAGDGWAVESEAVDGVWLVTATTMTALDDRVVRETRARLDGLARDHGGQYDGWEAAAG